MRLLCTVTAFDGRAVNANPVVHPVLPALPELDDLGRDQVATPVRRHRHLIDIGEPLGDIGQLLRAARRATRSAC